MGLGLSAMDRVGKSDKLAFSLTLMSITKIYTIASLIFLGVSGKKGWESLLQTWMCLEEFTYPSSLFWSLDIFFNTL